MAMALRRARRVRTTLTAGPHTNQFIIRRIFVRVGGQRYLEMPLGNVLNTPDRHQELRRAREALRERRTLELEDGSPRRRRTSTSTLQTLCRDREFMPEWIPAPCANTVAAHLHLDHDAIDDTRRRPLANLPLSPPPTAAPLFNNGAASPQELLSPPDHNALHPPSCGSHVSEPLHQSLQLATPPPTQFVPVSVTQSPILDLLTV